MFKYHNDGSLPENGEIFVFGSNLAGIHGAGAAKVAKEQFGAVYGAGMGLMGQSYAIPTKSLTVDTLPLEIVKLHIQQFCLFTYNFQDMNYFVTRVGCGLAGFKDEDIAPLFRIANMNCSFAKEWKQYLV